MLKILTTTLLLFCICLPAMGQSSDKVADAVKDAADKIKSIVGDFSELEEPKMTVRGRVFYEETGQPLRRSWVGFVKIRNLNPKPEDAKDGDEGIATSPWEYVNTESVLTNDFGEFVMKDVSPGVYQVVTKVPGILNPTLEDRESTLFQQFVFDGVTEAQIEVGVRRGGALSGRVLYQDGAPLIGAVVTLLSVKHEAEKPVATGSMIARAVDAVRAAAGIKVSPVSNIGTSMTDDRGYYRFAGVPEGEYMVMVAEPSVFDGADSKIAAYSTSRYYSTSELKTFYPNAKDKVEASSLQVFLGEELTEINITLAPRELYEVVGRVVGAGNNALVNGIQVMFEKDGDKSDSDYQSQQIRTTTTNKEGIWKFKDLLPGKYVAHVSEPSYRRYYEEEEETPSRPNYATSEHKFEVLPSETNEVIIRIAVEGNLRGSISVEGNQELPDTVSVFADTATKRASSDSPETTDYTDEDSRQKVRTEFHVDDLKAGEYFLSVKASEGFYAKSITRGGKNLIDQPIKIKAGETLNDFKVVLSRDSGTVEGKITDAESGDYLYVHLMPVRSDISLYRAFLLSDSDYAGDENTFEIKAKPGTYYLFATEGSGSAPTKDVTPEKLEVWVRDLIKSAEKVRLEPGKKIKSDIKKPAETKP